MPPGNLKLFDQVDLFVFSEDNLMMSTEWALMRGVPGTLNTCELSFQTPNPIDLTRARLQHERYRLTLESLGVTVEMLPADDRFPDCCFVEDTAVLIDETAIICRTGAVSRRGEVDSLRPHLLGRGFQIVEMSAPAQLDGGDVLQIEGDIFVGISQRTNRAGFEVISEVARHHGRTAFPVEVLNALHLKTVCTYLGQRAIIGQLNSLGEGRLSMERFQTFQPVEGEEEAANVFRVNNRLLVPAHCEQTIQTLANSGFDPFPIDVSEFHKAEAGLTCLSICGH